MKQIFKICRHAAIVVLALTGLACGGAVAQDKNSSDKAAKSDSQPGGEPGAITRGRVVFQDRCAICHFNQSDAKKIGPGLKGLFNRGKFRDGGKIDDASIEKRILNGGKDMPPANPALNSPQIHDLIAYLKNL